MSVQLETERLLLRPPCASDISQLVPLLDDYEVSKNLSPVPHPYTEEDASAFIVRVNYDLAAKTDYVFAIQLRSGVFIGLCGVHPRREWEFGYWLGRPFWRQGFATEAASRVVTFAFEELDAEMLKAGWFHDNPASGRVLAKLGFQPCGDGERSCTARGCVVNCHLVELDRATYMTRKKTS
jgi:[ribosomal protein S5]-alanine N-acetyltransferase